MEPRHQSLLPPHSTLFSSVNFTEPIPVDNPTFHAGGPIRGNLADAGSAFHPQFNATSFKTRAPGGPSHTEPNRPPSSVASSSRLSYDCSQRMLDLDDEDMLESVEEDVESDVMTPDEQVFFTQYLRNMRPGDWPDWDTLTSVAVSTARSSVECAPHKPSDSHLPSVGSYVQKYDLRGHPLPQPYYNSYGHSKYPVQRNVPHLQHLYAQPRNTPFDPHSSSSSSSFTSSRSCNSHPPTSTVSPSASSDISSSPSSPSSSPELTIRTPITLHQPRPSRRIPICSLSELALACDEFTLSPPTHNPRYQELLSPLIMDFPANQASVHSPVHPLPSGEYRIDSSRFSQGHPDGKFGTEPTYISHRMEELRCSCGCMETYNIPPKNIYPIV